MFQVEAPQLPLSIAHVSGHVMAMLDRPRDDLYCGALRNPRNREHITGAMSPTPQTCFEFPALDDPRMMLRARSGCVSDTPATHTRA
jgi:hypothetical protein